MVEIIDESIARREYVKKFAKQMLKSTLFIGTYHEKRFVECLNEYRDVIRISDQETAFITNLLVVKKRIQHEFIKIPWIGITDSDGIGTPAGCNIWVELPSEAFGTYWFKVKSVEFDDSQIYLKINVIRTFLNENATARNMSVSIDPSNMNLNVSLDEIQNWLKSNLINIYQNVLTFHNIKSSLIFLFLLVSSLVLSLINIIKYMLDYSLKLINELSHIITALTPIIINCTNMLGRAVLGLFNLIYLLFRRNPSQPIYNAYINYDPKTGNSQVPYRFNKNIPKAIPYHREGSSVRIQEIY